MPVRDSGEPTVLAILGMGLMGGSLGLAALRRKTARRVIGYDLSPERGEQALALGAITEVARSAGEAASKAELVVIATPVGTIAAVFAEIVPYLEPGTIVTDVGSTKLRIVQEIMRLLPEHSHFIGGHPVAGSERDGIEAASPELYTGCPWILTPTDQTAAPTYRRLVRFLGQLGAHVLSLNPARHDELLALTSHLPQVLASTLMSFAAEAAAAEGGLPLVSAGAFQDMTRIAASSPDLWVDILRENRTTVLGILARFEDVLRDAGDAMESGDWDRLRKTLAAARDARNALPGKPGLAPMALVEVLIPVPDRPGVLADVTTTVGEAGVNIEDIDIIHSADGGRGTILLAVNGEAAARLARESLRRKGYRVD